MLFVDTGAAKGREKTLVHSAVAVNHLTALQAPLFRSIFTQGCTNPARLNLVWWRLISVGRQYGT